MAIFSDITTRMLRIINRPSSEVDVLAEVKASINDAILFLQRNHAFAYTEKVSTFIYPANSLSVDLGILCEGSLRDVISIQQIASGGTYEGKPLKIKSYSSLQGQRARFERTHGVDNAEIYSELMPSITIEDAYRQDMIAWVMGSSIGLYPRPSTAITFLLHHHVWLPVLADDTDTNFFLDYTQDVVVMLALKRLNFFMKLDSRHVAAQAEVDSTLLGLFAWDSQIKENPMTTIG